MYKIKADDCFEVDRGWKFPVSPVCVHCNDEREITSVKEWVSAARECFWMEQDGNNLCKALAECRKIVIDGSTDCPICGGN